MTNLVVDCPYCGQQAQLVGGESIYPHRPDLFDKNFWLCHPCGAYVGCHQNSKVFAPLGTLADAPTRGARRRAHATFDPLWKSGEMSRTEAYNWLADALDYERGKCHISWMSYDEALAVEAVCKMFSKMKKRGINGYKAVKTDPAYVETRG